MYNVHSIHSIYIYIYIYIYIEHTLIISDSHIVLLKNHYLLTINTITYSKLK